MTFDHVALPSNDIGASVEWYVAQFGAKVLYQDKTWAFLEVGGQKLALVTPSQHPPHLAIRVSQEQLNLAARSAGVPIDRHRDGTTGIYIHDPFGNAVELICYPPGETVYEKSRPETHDRQIDRTGSQSTKTERPKKRLSNRSSLRLPSGPGRRDPQSLEQAEEIELSDDDHRILDGIWKDIGAGKLGPDDDILDELYDDNADDDANDDDPPAEKPKG